jgi:hypothetical protein
VSGETPEGLMRLLAGEAVGTTIGVGTGD